ncbi:MAG: hypothetical protein H6738_05680 [Alphaproteobacteria bacterium]|nr:hypothetical protein [Alphaproteobacteria bacterium]MCB9696259.1 hypothetical protein [Alphaproteobacteria bacterium]
MLRTTMGCLVLILVGCSDDGRGGKGGKKGNCGASGSEFEVEVLGATVFPYKPETESPWDWDGDIPDWMIDVTDALGDIAGSPELKTAAEILTIVDEVAPLLLTGTVPPDPVLQVVAALDTGTTTTTSTFFGGTTTTTTYGTFTFATLDTEDDTYEPVFRQRVDVDLFSDETLWLDVWDEDLTFDDYVGSVGLKLRDLRDLGGCGKTTLRGPVDGGLYSVDVTVEPL